MDKIQRMKELIALMKEEALAYYGEDSPIVSDKRYDQQFDELARLEAETGIAFSDSPTQIVSGGLLDSLAKVAHDRPVLSAAKTKRVEDIIEFAEKAKALDDSRVMVSWKEDGLTLVLKYAEGVFRQAITRGSDGITGEDVSHTVRTFRSVPMKIPYKEPLVLRGEGVISWKTFERLNDILEEPFSHPRNLAAGSVRQLDASVAGRRGLELIAFELITPALDTKDEQFALLDRLGFRVVEHQLADAGQLEAVIGRFEPAKYAYPVDGLIVEYNDNVFGRALGSTGHHENLRMALKWEDETVTTVFQAVEAQPTRTGRIGLVAVFEPVMIDGTTVSRATLHNVSVFEELRLGCGDKINVYKANKIIPAIDENLTMSGTYRLTDRCPCCESELVIKRPNKSTFLYCPNHHCPAKQIKTYVHFSSRPAMNIVGLSDASLEKFVQAGYIRHFSDIYHIDAYRDEIIRMDGWGEKSYAKLWESIQKSRTVPMANFLYALGIPLIGKGACRDIEAYYRGDFAAFSNDAAGDFDFSVIFGFGAAINDSIHRYFGEPALRKEISLLLDEVTLTRPDAARENAAASPFSGKTVVATGALKYFTRDEIEEKLRQLGAKTAASVSRNTHYVIAGERAGSKLDKARALGVPVLTEEEFIRMTEG